MLILVPPALLAGAPSLHLHWRRHCLRPGAKGSFRGRASPNENCAPLSEDCAPKKVTCSVPLECSSRLDTDHHPRIRVQEPFFRRFCFEDLFVVFLVFTHEFEGTKFLCPPKNDLCLPTHATLAPDIQISKFVCSPS